jgi:hypothetical protein
MERFSHRAVQAVTDGYLIPVGAVPIPEPLNIDSNDRPVNGQALIRHLPPLREQRRASSYYLGSLSSISSRDRPTPSRIHLTVPLHPLREGHELASVGVDADGRATPGALDVLSTLCQTSKLGATVRRSREAD